jgi:hypothetical protein
VNRPENSICRGSPAADDAAEAAGCGLAGPGALHNRTWNKNFPINERVGLKMRVEAFNVFNARAGPLDQPAVD